MRTLHVYGGGGHGKVVVDAAQRAGWERVVVVDDAPGGRDVLGIPVEPAAGIDWRQMAGFRFVVAIGSNEIRRRLFRLLAGAGGEPAVVVHPAAVVARSARIGVGTVVFAGAIINPDVAIGENTIINTAASVDHDCRVGAHVHVCPGVRLAGGVAVGDGTLVGTGVSVIPGVRIGVCCIVGAGAAVIRDLPDGVTACGIPARIRP